MTSKREIIRGVPLLANLPPAEIDYLAEALHAMEISAGTLLLEKP
jgi:hypothetical protein